MTINFFSKNKWTFLVLIVASLFLNGCKGDDDMDPGGGDEELITTLSLDFEQAGQSTLTYTFRDVDGPGGNAATVDDIVLAPGATYTLKVRVSDDSKDPAEDITAEIEDEKDEHLFIYTVTDANLTVTILDQDSKGKPVGLSGAAVSAGQSTGTLKVVLKHEPDKDAANPGSTGETDIEVTFPVRIE